MKRPAFPKVDEPPLDTSMHPEDVESERLSRAAAAKHGRGILAPHAEEIALLITCYPDDEAHDALDRMREWFWAFALPLEPKP